MKVLITGAGGQLGLDLVSSKLKQRFDLTGLTKSELNVCDQENLRKSIYRLNPDFVVNCAAFTNLNGSEQKDSQNFPVNFYGSHNLGEICHELGIGLIHLSTDAVFSSKTERIFCKEEKPCPINQYGKAKAAAEEDLLKRNSKLWVIRTSWLFGKYGGNFFQSILNSARLQKSIEVVSAQHGQPTWTEDVTKAISLILTGRAKPGIYHATGLEVQSRFSFAKEIYRIVGADESLVVPKKFEFQKDVAPRANFCILETDRDLEKLGWKATSLEKAVISSI